MRTPFKQRSQGSSFKMMGASPVKQLPWGAIATGAARLYKWGKGLSKVKKATAVGTGFAAHTAAADKTKNRSTTEKIVRGLDEAFLLGAGSYVWDNRKGMASKEASNPSDHGRPKY